MKDKNGKKEVQGLLIVHVEGLGTLQTFNALHPMHMKHV